MVCTSLALRDQQTWCLLPRTQHLCDQQSSLHQHRYVVSKTYYSDTGACYDQGTVELYSHLIPGGETSYLLERWDHCVSSPKFQDFQKREFHLKVQHLSDLNWFNLFDLPGWIYWREGLFEMLMLWVSGKSDSALSSIVPSEEQPEIWWFVHSFRYYLINIYSAPGICFIWHQK